LPTTPYPATLYAGNQNYTITMPDIVVVGGVTYYFNAWTDTDPTNTTPANRVRTIYLDHNINLIAQYVPYFEVSISSAPINVEFMLTGPT